MKKTSITEIGNIANRINEYEIQIIVSEARLCAMRRKIAALKSQYRDMLNQYNKDIYVFIQEQIENEENETKS